MHALCDAFPRASASQRYLMMLQERVDALEDTLSKMTVASSPPTDLPPSVHIEGDDDAACVQRAFLRVHVTSEPAVERLLRAVERQHTGPLGVSAYMHATCAARDLFVSDAVSPGGPDEHRFTYDAGEHGEPGADARTVQMLVEFRHSVVVSHLAAILAAALVDDLDTSTPERIAVFMVPIHRGEFAVERHCMHHLVACRRGAHVTRVRLDNEEWVAGPDWSRRIWRGYDWLIPYRSTATAAAALWDLQGRQMCGTLALSPAHF